MILLILFKGFSLGFFLDYQAVYSERNASKQPIIVLDIKKNIGGIAVYKSQTIKYTTEQILKSQISKFSIKHV